MHRRNERRGAHLENEHPDNGQNGGRVGFVQGVLPTGDGDDRLGNNECDQTDDNQGSPPENVDQEGPDEFEEEVGARRAKVDRELCGRRRNANGVQGWTEIV